MKQYPYSPAIKQGLPVGDSNWNVKKGDWTAEYQLTIKNIKGIKDWERITANAGLTTKHTKDTKNIWSSCFNCVAVIPLGS